MSSGQNLTIPISDFKTHCVRILARIERTGEHVVVTRRGAPIARIGPATKAIESDEAYASLRGTMTVAPGVDLTKPVVAAAEWDVEGGE